MYKLHKIVHNLFTVLTCFLFTDEALEYSLRIPIGSVLFENYYEILLGNRELWNNPAVSNSGSRQEGGGKSCMNKKTSPSILCSYAMQQGIIERGKYLQLEGCIVSDEEGVGGGIVIALF